MLQRHLATRPRAVVQLSLLLLVQNPLLPRPEIRAHEPQPISRVSRRLQQPISRERASKPNEPIMLQHLQLRLRAFPQRRVPALPSRIDRVSKPSLAVSRLVDFAHARVRVSLLRRHERHDVSRFQSRPSRAAASVIHLSRWNLQRLARPRLRRRSRASFARARRRRSRSRSRERRQRSRVQRAHRRRVIDVVVINVVVGAIARVDVDRLATAIRAREHGARWPRRARGDVCRARIERSRARDRRFKPSEPAKEGLETRRGRDATRRNATRRTVR